jgi:cellulose synthase/poly-beta-1,6-N-acetylglucosamine synthase-like glycosyltransferase
LLILFNIILILYPLLIYPFIIKVLSAKKPDIKSNPIIENPVAITIIISAYNEEGLISDAIHSVFNSDYPPSLIQLIVGSDGSTDNTNNILLSMRNLYPNLEPHILDRMGKNAVLNTLSPLARGKYLFYMDADCRLQKDSINRLLSILKNEDIGAVISSMNSIEEEDSVNNLGGQGEGKYQMHEQTLRINESKIHSTVSALGAFYGIKKEFYSPLPNKNVCDDWMPLMHVLMNNKRVVSLDDTEVFEVRGKSLKNEINRRIRITSGGIATIWASKKLLNPKYGWVTFALFSHKVMRNLLPLFTFAIIILSLILFNTIYFLPIFLIMLLFVILSLIGKFSKKSNKLTKVPKLCSYFIFMVTAQFLGLISFLFDKNISTWDH